MAGERRFLTAREQASLRGAESLLNGPDQAYDEWDWFKRHDEHPPVEAPAGLTWFHVSPADLEPGTVLAPFRGGPPWGDDPYQGGLGNRADWVWVEHDEDKSRAWMHWVLDHQPQCRLYRVTPRLGPYAWNGTADEGWVTDSAVVEELLFSQAKAAARGKAQDYPGAGDPWKGRGPWYHVSPHRLNPGTVLAPAAHGGGKSPWSDQYDKIAPARKDWVFVTKGKDVDHWLGQGIIGGEEYSHLDHPFDLSNRLRTPWFVYRVEPAEAPQAWNGNPMQEGWATPAARVVEMVGRGRLDPSEWGEAIHSPDRGGVDYEPLGKGWPRRHAAGPRVIPVGFNDDQTTCALCGREELKGTVVLGYESGGEYGRFGTGCASKVMSEVNGTPRRITRSDAQKLEAFRRDQVMHHLNKATKALQAGDVAQAQWEIADMRRNPNAVPHRQDELDAIAAVDATGSYRSVGRNLEPGELQEHYRHRVENGLPEYETSVAPNQ